MRPALDGSVVVLTGASSGIGRALAWELASRARALVLVARRVELLEELAAELAETYPALAVRVERCDLCNGPACDALVERVEREVGPVDVLVNNAGVGVLGMFDRMDWERIERSIQTNVVALVRLTHRVVASMVERRRGGILNVSSLSGVEFTPAYSVYCGGKHFVTAFTECLRLELRALGIVVSQLNPGPVDTEFVRIAGNPLGRDVPAWVNMSPERCARIAVRGFSRGKALIVPGVLSKIAYFFATTTPRWLKRLFYRPIARKFRRIEESQRPAEALEDGSSR